VRGLPSVADLVLLGSLVATTLCTGRGISAEWGPWMWGCPCPPWTVVAVTVGWAVACGVEGRLGFGKQVLPTRVRGAGFSWLGRGSRGWASAGGGHPEGLVSVLGVVFELVEVLGSVLSAAIRLPLSDAFFLFFHSLRFGNTGGCSRSGADGGIPVIVLVPLLLGLTSCHWSPWVPPGALVGVRFLTVAVRSPSCLVPVLGGSPVVCLPGSSGVLTDDVVTGGLLGGGVGPSSS
jgi:hypothetical protein